MIIDENNHPPVGIMGGTICSYIRGQRYAPGYPRGLGASILGWHARDRHGNDRFFFPDGSNYGDPEPVSHAAAVSEVLEELARATARFPEWPTDPLHALAVLSEEHGELTQAVLQEIYEPGKQKRDAVRKEALQTAAMAIRFLASLPVYKFDKCLMHLQPAATK